MRNRNVSLSVSPSLRPTLHKMLFAFSTLTASDWHVFLSCVEGEGSIVIMAFFIPSLLNAASASRLRERQGERERERE